MNFFSPYIPSFSLLIVATIVVTSCKSASSTTVTPALNSLTAKVWLFHQASVAGKGYRLDFQRGRTGDPFGLAKVRVKFNADGTISGFDNMGGPIKNGIWEQLDNGQKITVSGTNTVGIDGTSSIDKLSETTLMVSDKLDVPQVGSVTVIGVLIHE